MSEHINVALVRAAQLASSVEEGLVEHELPVPPVVYGAGAMVVFLLLLGITYSFRSVAHRR